MLQMTIWLEGCDVSEKNKLFTSQHIKYVFFFYSALSGSKSVLLLWICGTRQCKPGWWKRGSLWCGKWSTCSLTLHSIAAFCGAMLSELFMFACLIWARMEVWVLPAVLLLFNVSLELLEDIFWFFAAFSKLRNMHSGMYLSEHPSSDAIWRSNVNGPSQIPTLKAKRFHRPVSDAQMKGRSSISWRFLVVKAPNQRQTSVTSYHPHLEGEGCETCGGEDSRRVSGHGRLTREAAKLKHDYRTL